MKPELKLALILASLVCTATHCEGELGHSRKSLAPPACHANNDVPQSPSYSRLLLQIDTLAAAQVAYASDDDERMGMNREHSDQPSARFLQQRLLCAASIIRSYRTSSHPDRMFKKHLLEAYLLNARAVGLYQALLDKHPAQDLSSYGQWTPSERVRASEASTLQADANERLRRTTDSSLSQIVSGWPTGSKKSPLTCQEASALHARLEGALKGSPSVFSMTARTLFDFLGDNFCIQVAT